MFRKELLAWMHKHYPQSTTASTKQLAVLLRKAVVEGKITVKQVNALQRGETIEDKPAPKLKKGQKKMVDKKTAVTAVKAGKLFGGGAGGNGKRPTYSKDKPVGKNKLGQVVLHPISGNEVRHASQWEKAKVGTWLLHKARRDGLPARPLDADEKYILDQMIAEDEWQGGYSIDEGKQFAPREVRALLDDSTSGGIYAAPIWFDEMLITYPLLFGQLMPYVQVVDVPRGRRIEAASMNTPVFSWGVAEGTAITPFNTAAMIAQLPTSIFNVVCGIEVGNDMLSDASVTDLGGQIVQKIGERSLQEFDKVIAAGDGVTQPAGLLSATGYSAVLSDNGPGGGLTVGDLEQLMFGLAMEYRSDASLNTRFVMNDVTYRRWRSIPVGPTDERRVLGIGGGYDAIGSYQLMGSATSVAPTFSNSQAAYVALKKYRFYRRAGCESVWTREGNYLTLRNLSLLVVRGRFGGRLMDPAAMALCSDLQA